MAPPNWATSEQLTFLRSYIPIFADYTAKETQSKFWPRISEDWFSRWPELDVLIKEGRLPPQARSANPDAPYLLTDEERELYGTAIQTRKQKLQNWMRNNSRKVVGASKVSKTRVTASTLGLLNPRKRQRMHQEQEVYHRMYKDKVEKLVKEAFAEQLPELQHLANASDDEDESDNNSEGEDSSKDRQTEPRSLLKLRSLRMKIRREVRAKAWANETEEIRRQVREELKREKEVVAEINGEEGKVGLERSPASRELVISNLVGVLKDTCAEIHRLSGWSTIALTGGPHPALKNKISLQTVTFGQTAAGSSFNESYAGFQSDFVHPYLAWLKNVYADPLLVCSTATPTEASIKPTEDEDSTKAVNAPTSPLDLDCGPASAPEDSPDRCEGEEPAAGSPEEENPFQSRPNMPITDCHLQDGNDGPSEPISWAFQRQGLGDSFESDPRSFPLPPFEDDSAHDSQPPIPSPSTTIRDVNVDATLLDSLSTARIPQTLAETNVVFGDVSPPRVPLPSPTICDETIDPTLLQTPPAGAIPETMAETTVILGGESPAIHNQTFDSTPSYSSPPGASPQSDINPFIYNATPAVAKSTAAVGTLSDSMPPTQTSTHPLTSCSMARPPSIYSSLLSGGSSKAAPPAVDISTTSPHRSRASTIILTSLATTTPNPDGTPHSLAPIDPVPPQELQTRGRGRGRGGRGRRGGRGGRVAKENTVQVQARRLSPATRRRIDALNKRVYPPDGAAPGPPLGASHSINADGVYPCITFRGPPPAPAPKKRSRDVVSEGDIVSGKRARKERVRKD